MAIVALRPRVLGVKYALLVISVVLAASSNSLYSQTPPLSDSVKIAPDTTKLLAPAIRHSNIEPSDTAALGDTLIAPKPPFIEAFDFTRRATHAILPRHSAQSWRLRLAPYHDAGDLLAGASQFFAVDYMPIPVRHTISPYGLYGQRPGIIFDNHTLAPLDHMVEPDGQIDFNDLSPAAITDVFVVDGPALSFLGGSGGVGGVYLEKLHGDTLGARSRMEVQKGDYSYANTKGLIAEKFASGYSYTAALEYDKTESQTFPIDNTYRHFWELSAPFSERLAVTGAARFLRREAEFFYRPRSNAVQFERERRNEEYQLRAHYRIDENRSLSVTGATERDRTQLTRQSIFRELFSAHTDRAAFEYARNSQQGAVAWNGELARENFALKDYSNTRHRYSAGLKWLKADSMKNNRASYLQVAGVGVGGFDPLPQMVLGLVHRLASREISFSAGFVPVFPRQYELDMPHATPIGEFSGANVSHRGAPNLTAERHLTTSFAARFGTGENAVTMSATGGKIFNSIMWLPEPDATTGGRIYSPANHDLSFLTLTATGSQRLTSWARSRLSLSWYGREYNDIGDAPYTPPYNAHAALFLEKYIRSLDMTLRGYGEAVTSGEYLGLGGAPLGKKPSFNAQAGFQVKSFSFNFVWENGFDRNTEHYEGYQYPGRYMWYWVNWSFLN